jgi:hypothetical protein
LSKRTSGKFRRRAQDAYDTPAEAVVPLLPFLPRQTMYCEPCVGSAKLIEALNPHGHRCIAGFDVVERGPGPCEVKDALKLTENDVQSAEIIITNPPWSRHLLHPMIEHFAKLRPTWLLFDADWMHTQQAAPFSQTCHKVVSVGRVSWMGNGTVGFDNCAWYFFDASQPWTGTRFFFRGSTQ